jgi:hypothetical protein
MQNNNQGRPLHSNDEAVCFIEKVGGTKLAQKFVLNGDLDNTETQQDFPGFKQT